MISIENLNFEYNEAGKTGLKNISVNIEKGECILLTGASGSGKTTFIRLINGLIPNFYNGEISGRVNINGKDLNKWSSSDLSLIVGSVFQNPRSQFFNLDTTSEIAFGCENQGISRAEIKERVKNTAKELNINHLLDRNIFSLSGGEKQMIAIASGYAMGAEIFVLDECSANLDADSMRLLSKIIKKLKFKKKTIIIAEHRLSYLKGLTDRVLYLNKGEIIKEWNAKEFESLGKDERRGFGLRSGDLSKISFNKDIKENKLPKDFIIKNLKFGYSAKKDVLKNVSCAVGKGEIISVIGKNGAGKTSFARCLCGLLKEKDGFVEFKGKKVSYKKRAGKVYLVMQDSGCQLFSDTIIGELELSSFNKKNETKFREILSVLSLSGMEDRHPMSLSGGEKQRLAIAAGVIQDSEIMVFDEPTSGLDLKSMELVNKVFKILKDQGKRIIVITHDLEFLLKVSDRAVLLDNGELINDLRLNKVNFKTIKSFF